MYLICTCVFACDGVSLCVLLHLDMCGLWGDMNSTHLQMLGFGHICAICRTTVLKHWLGKGAPLLKYWITELITR